MYSFQPSWVTQCHECEETLFVDLGVREDTANQEITVGVSKCIHCTKEILWDLFHYVAKHSATIDADELQTFLQEYLEEKEIE